MHIGHIFQNEMDLKISLSKSAEGFTPYGSIICSFKLVELYLLTVA